MTNLRILLLLCIYSILILVSCQKKSDDCLGCSIVYPPDETLPFTISGQLGLDCNGLFYANKMVAVAISQFGNCCDPAGIPAITDSMGNFSITYYNTVHYNPFQTENEQCVLQFPEDSFYIMLPINEDVVINYTVEDSATLIISLKTDSEFSADDTLYYTIYREPTVHKVIGPFNNGILDTIRFEKRNWFRNLSGDSYDILWGMGYSNFYTPEGPYLYGNYNTVQHSLCSTDTVTLHIK